MGSVGSNGYRGSWINQPDCMYPWQFSERCMISWRAIDIHAPKSPGTRWLSLISRLQSKGVWTAGLSIVSQRLNTLLPNRSYFIVCWSELPPWTKAGWHWSCHFLGYSQVSSWILSLQFFSSCYGLRCQRCSCAHSVVAVIHTWTWNVNISKNPWNTQPDSIWELSWMQIDNVFTSVSSAITGSILLFYLTYAYTTTAVGVFRYPRGPHLTGCTIVAQKTTQAFMVFRMQWTVEPTELWTLGKQFRQYMQWRDSETLIIAWLLFQSTLLFDKRSRTLNMFSTTNVGI